MPVDGSTVLPPVHGPTPPSRPAVTARGVDALLHPTTPAHLEEQLDRVEARLLREAGDDVAAQLDVRRQVAAARERFATATVTQFLPILVEREARRRMREERRDPADIADAHAAASGIRTGPAAPPR